MKEHYLLDSWGLETLFFRLLQHGFRKYFSTGSDMSSSDMGWGKVEILIGYIVTCLCGHRTSDQLNTKNVGILSF